MLNAKPAESRVETVRGDTQLDAGDNLAVVPLSLPPLTGVNALKRLRAKSSLR